MWLIVILYTSVLSLPVQGESAFRNPGKFLLVEFGVVGFLESRTQLMQLTELKNGIRNLNSTFQSQESSIVEPG